MQPGDHIDAQCPHIEEQGDHQEVGAAHTQGGQHNAQQGKENAMGVAGYLQAIVGWNALLQEREREVLAMDQQETLSTRALTLLPMIK